MGTAKEPSKGEVCPGDSDGLQGPRRSCNLSTLIKPALAFADEVDHWRETNFMQLMQVPIGFCNSWV